MNPRTLGPRIGAKVQEVIRAVTSGNVPHSADTASAAGIELEPGEYEVRLVAADPDSTAALPGSTGLVALATSVTPELAAEGTASDVARVVQQARRDADLAVSDRIRLIVGADGAVADAASAHTSFLTNQTFAVEVAVVPPAAVDAPAQPVGDGGSVKVAVSVAQ